MRLLLLLLAFFLSPRTRAGEIIGGHEAEPHSRPYMAFLHIKNGTSKWSCGGFLIHEKFVLTAGHCMERSLHTQGRKITVILGAHNIKKKEKPQQLEKNAKVTKEVQILQLPKGESWVKPGTVCKVAGWGRLTIDGKPANTLHEVEMTVQKDEVCKKHFSSYNSAIQICAGDPNTQKGSYKGDSGGPFICNNVVQAVISYGNKKHGPNPHVYTKISPYLSWIKKNMKQHLMPETKEDSSLRNCVS